MYTTVVFAHPWHGSFNKAILDEVTSSLGASQKDFRVIDLNKDSYNASLSEQDLALFSKGETADKTTIEYQKSIQDSDELVFIYPTWWYDAPAILKGFIDKVMLKGFAYKETKTGLKGLLTHVKRTTVITTSEYPTWYLRLLHGNLFTGMPFHAILRGVGLKNIKWMNNPWTSSGTSQRRMGFLSRIRTRFAGAL